MSNGADLIEKAKQALPKYAYKPDADSDIKLAQTYALISIAESLEKISQRFPSRRQAVKDMLDGK